MVCRLSPNRAGSIAFYSLGPRAFTRRGHDWSDRYARIVEAAATPFGSGGEHALDEVSLYAAEVLESGCDGAATPVRKQRSRAIS
jgi:hypothetical protein